MISISGALLRREVEPPALLVGAGALLPLLDHLAEDRKDLGVRHAVGVVLGPRRDVAVLDRGADQPQRRNPLRILGLDRFLQIP